MLDSRQWPATWLFGLLVLPLGIYVGFIWTALPLLLSQAGLAIGQIARINAILQVPPILLFLWTPVVDVKLRRRTWLVLGALATALLLWVACQIGTTHVRLLTALLFFAGVVVALVPASCGGLMATMLSASAQAKASGWNQAGNWGGVGLGGAAVLWLVARFSLSAAGWLQPFSLPCRPFSPSPSRSRRPLRRLGFADASLNSEEKLWRYFAPLDEDGVFFC
jgi:MFS family permease